MKQAGDTVLRTRELKMLKWAAILFLVIYLLHQFYSSVYNPLVTDMVVYDSSYVGVELETLFVRNETLVSSTQGGYKSYAVSEGGKVAKNGVIASVYPTAEQAALSSSIQEIQQQIDILSKTQNYTEYNNADLTVINQKINRSFMNLLDSSKTGTLNAAAGDELLQNLNRKNIVTGTEQNYNALIAQLNTQLAALQAQHTKSQSYIRAEDSGYFVSKADGYETALQANALSSLTVAQFESVQPAEVAENVIGKIVADYEWNIIAKIPLEDSFHLAEGDQATLKTGLVSVQELKTTVKAINREGDTKFALIVFSCKTMNNELASTRRQTMTLVTESYSGLKVNKKAVRMVEGKKGVYTYSASQAHFVPIRIVYTTPSFVICEKISENGSLRLYDEVIVKGKGLYDGKIIN